MGELFNIVRYIERVIPGRALVKAGSIGEICAGFGIERREELTVGQFRSKCSVFL